MIKALFENYSEVGWAGIVMIAMVWYFYYQTKCQSKRDEKHDAIQKEEREFSRGIVKDELKDLANASLKNAELNNQSISMLKDHSKFTETFSVKVIESLAIVAERLNGGTEGTKAIARLKKLEKVKK